MAKATNNEPQWIFDGSLSEQECIALHCQQRARLFTSWKYLLGLFLLGTAAGVGWGYRPSDVPQSLTTTEIALAPLYGLLFAGFMVLVQETQIRQSAKKQCALSQGLIYLVSEDKFVTNLPHVHHEIQWDKSILKGFHIAPGLVTLQYLTGADTAYLFHRKMNNPKAWDSFVDFLKCRLPELPT